MPKAYKDRYGIMELQGKRLIINDIGRPLTQWERGITVESAKIFGFLLKPEFIPGTYIKHKGFTEYIFFELEG